jgi:hypothetical protein
VVANFIQRHFLHEGDNDDDADDNVGRDSSVGIATRYGLDGPGIESLWGGEIFRILPDRPWGPPSLLYNGYRVFTGG